MTADLDVVLLDMVNKQSEELNAGASKMADAILGAANAQLAASSLTVPALTLENYAETLAAVLEQIPESAEGERAAVNTLLEQLDQVKSDMKTRWRKEATLMLQITQNYVTPNWYQGGSSSFAALGIAKGQIGYFGDRFTWENFGEWRMGCSTISADSLHKINTTDDLFRLYTKANYQIVPTLFASSSAEFETRVLPTYKSNSMDLKSAPFAPLRFNAAIGLDYKPVKNLSISFSPLSYKVIYIHDTVRVNVKDYGLKPGMQTRHDIGSSLRLEYTWKPVREFAMETKFFFYTNYHDVELDLEVNCDFIINRFLSARLTLHPRYDTSVVMDGDDKAKIQFRELLSIGFAHKFR